MYTDFSGDVKSRIVSQTDIERERWRDQRGEKEREKERASHVYPPSHLMG